MMTPETCSMDTTAPDYHHVQRGWLMPVALFGGAAFSAVIIFIAGREEEVPTAVWLAPAFILACGFVFAGLGVTVDARGVLVRWGLGWPRARFAWSDIESFESCEHGWWYGYGLRWTPRGWLWNIQGPWAVRLKLRSGKCFHVGTDDLEGFLAALHAGHPEHPDAGSALGTLD